RSQSIQEVGLLDEDYFFLEETDWCYRMRRRRWQMCHVPQAKVIFFKKHRGTAELIMLKGCLFMRFCIDFLLAFLSCLFTAFRKERLKRKLGVYPRFVYWHLRLCPEGMGLGGG
ncbi:MAG: hypothetical protein JSW70_03165, partial [Syntrophobacterales bacterium]